MQVVAAVVGGQQCGGVRRVAHRGVEVDHAVEHAAVAADEGVDVLPLRLVGLVQAL